MNSRPACRAFFMANLETLFGQCRLDDLFSTFRQRTGINRTSSSQKQSNHNQKLIGVKSFVIRAPHRHIFQFGMTNSGNFVSFT